MLRILKSASLLCLWFSTQFASASCDVNSILQATFHPHHHSSKWFQEKSNEFHQPPFTKLKFQPAQRLIHVREGAIAAKNAEPLRILEDSDALQMGVNDFKEQFAKANKGKAPVLDHYIKFYDSRYQLYRSAMNDFLEEMIRLDPEKKAFWTHTVKAQTDRVHAAYKFAKGNNKNFETVWTNFHNNLVGSSAELHASLALPGVEMVSFHLNQFMSQKIADRMKQLLQDAKTDPTVLDRFSQQYPLIAENRGMGNANQLWTSKIESIGNWLKSKEIDVVRKADGKTAWVEVKRNTSPFTERSFHHGEMGKKSYAEQILENKQVIEFMGLENEIQLEYLATGGMDSTVKRFLESNGVKVLEP